MTSEVGWEFWPGGRYDPATPTWPAVLGYAPGERITRCADISRFLAALADGSERVRREVYGQSWEGRELQIAVVSTPGNLACLEEIRARLARLADPRTLPPGAGLDALVRETPAVVWVAANVHGGEHSTAEAAMLLAYQLAAGEDETTRAIREQTVVVIDPLQNPDGRERSLGYFYGAFGLRPNPDPNAAEHHAPWPGPRGNHYLFDLNRDWIYLTQRETAAKVAVFLRWRPQVFIDLHEMGTDSTFFFPPPAPPINACHPEVTHNWWEVFGRAIGQALDTHGVAYYVRESFDCFFPGYGEAWPSYHGATGMTFEQATVQGHVIRRRDETLLTLREALHHHFLACMAVCTVAAERREEVLRDFYAFHVTAIAEGAAGPVREYLIPPPEGEAKAPTPDAAALATTLTRQGIEVRVATAAFAHPAARGLREETARQTAFPAGTLIVRLDQPAARLARTLFEAEAPLEEAFVREELERREQRRADRFYDVTAWSLADSTGLPVWCGMEFSEAATEAWSADGPQTDDDRRADAPHPGSLSDMTHGNRPVAYLLPYNSNAAAYCLARLLDGDVRVHVAREPFRYEGRPFERGTLVIRRRDNPDDLPDRLAALAAACGVTFTLASSSWTDEGISLGSEQVVPLKKPKVAVLYDQPVSALSYGWLAYLLEQRAALSFTAARYRLLAEREVYGYTVLVLPDGSDYPRFLDEPVLKRLWEWVHAGGVLVALRGAAAFLAREPPSPELRFTTVRYVSDLRELRQEAKPGAQTEKREFAEKESEISNESRRRKEEEIPWEHRPTRVPGAVLKTRLDPYHPLCYGYGETLNVLGYSDRIFTPSVHGWNAVRFAAAEELRVSGFLWETMRDALAGQAYLVDEPLGRGHVILFAEDPNFRAAWSSLTRLFMSALLLLPSVTR